MPVEFKRTTLQRRLRHKNDGCGQRAPCSFTRDGAGKTLRRGIKGRVPILNAWPTSRFAQTYFYPHVFTSIGGRWVLLCMKQAVMWALLPATVLSCTKKTSPRIVLLLPKIQISKSNAVTADRIPTYTHVQVFTIMHSQAKLNPVMTNTTHTKIHLLRISCMFSHRPVPLTRSATSIRMGPVSATAEGLLLLSRCRSCSNHAAMISENLK